LDGAGHCQATMSIVVPEHKVQQKDPDLIALVRESARRVERRLGWLR
jgi:DNA-binding IclR family transcriptional regulator